VRAFPLRSSPGPEVVANRGWLLGAATVLALGLVLLEPRRPLIAVAAVAAVGLAALAARSPAIPLAVWAGSLLVPLVIGQAPKGATVTTFAAWSMLGIAIAILRADRPRPRLAAAVNLSVIGTALILALLLVRFPASLSPGYGSQKIQLFVLLAIVPFIGGVLIGYVRRDLALYLKIFGGLILAAALFDVYLVATGRANTLGSDRLSLSQSTNPIGLARNMGELLLILIFAIVRTGRGRVRLGLLAATPVVAFALLSSGSRGPLLGLVVAIPTLLVAARGDQRMVRRMLVTLGIGGVVVTVAATAFVPPAAAQRALSVFTGGTEQVGEVSRYTLWHEAVGAINDDWKHVLFGQGTGSFDAIDVYQEKYPHNIVLELWAELGIFGVAAFVLCLGSAIARLTALSATGGETGALAGLIVALLVFGLINALVSSDIAGNAGLWGWMGLGTGLAATRAPGLAGARRRIAPERPPQAMRVAAG
jgi:O-antigen ligase